MWRWVFWFNVPLCLVALAAGLAMLPQGGTGPERPSPRRRWATELDLSGNAALLVMMVLFTTGISLASDLHWSDPLVWGSLAVAAAILPVLVAIERRAARPVIDVEALRRQGLGRLYLGTFFNGAARFPVVVLVSVYLQAVLQVGPTQAGLQILPLPVGSLLSSLCVGRLSRRLDARSISLVGSCVGLVGVVLVAAALGLALPWLLPVGLAVVGAGNGLFTGSNATSMLESSPAESLGVVNAMRLMLHSTGNVTSMALALTILTVTAPDHLGERLLRATLPAGHTAEVMPGFWLALLFLCGLGVVGVACAAPGRRSARRRFLDPVGAGAREWRAERRADVP